MELIFKEKPTGCPFCTFLKEQDIDGDDEYSELICLKKTPGFEEYPVDDELEEFNFYCKEFVLLDEDPVAWRKENLLELNGFNEIW